MDEEKTVSPDETVKEDGAGSDKKSKKTKIIAGSIGALILVLGITHVVVANTVYKSRLIKGTTVSGVDVGGMTVEQAEEAVKNTVEDYAIDVTFPDGKTETITGEDIGLTYESSGNVEKALSEQNPYEWILGFFGKEVKHETVEESTYSKGKLRRKFESLPQMQEENITKAETAYMSFDDEGYISIVPEVYGNEPDEYKVLEVLNEAISGREFTVSLDESYYIQPEFKEDDEELINQVNDMNGFLDTTYEWTLHDGTVYTIGRNEIKDWLTTNNEEYPYYYVTEADLSRNVVAMANKIAEMDNELYSQQIFHTTASGDITIKAEGNYGYTVDVAKEADQLFADVMNRGQYTRSPVYSLTPADTGIGKEYGSTYAEVDIAHQHVYMYVNGNLIIDSPCVSGIEGDPKRRSDRGLFHVFQMNKNHTMRGADYTSFVNYVVFYNGGEGLHDAPWRGSSFGGNIYLTAGSHGCINLPYNVAKTIYENSYIGMPVIVFG